MLNLPQVRGVQDLPQRPEATQVNRGVVERQKSHAPSGLEFKVRPNGAGTHTTVASLHVVTRPSTADSPQILWQWSCNGCAAALMSLSPNFLVFMPPCERACECVCDFPRRAVAKCARHLLGANHKSCARRDSARETEEFAGTPARVHAIGFDRVCAWVCGVRRVQV